MKARHFRSSVVIALAVLVAAGTAKAADDIEEALELLQRMSVAMTQMTYQGTFVYVQGQNVETMRITHVVDEEGIHERLVAQSGPKREIVRDASGVRWIAGGSQAVVEEPSLSRSYFPQLSANAVEGAAEYYEIALIGTEPLAGRISRRMNIVPQDRYRYGYSLWLEEPTGLLLKWELYEDRSRPPLARLMFTDLRLGDDVDRTELVSDRSPEKFTAQAPARARSQVVTHAEPRWAPISLPPGFRLASHQRQNKQSRELFQHLVYSDGIATVSIFVEQIPGGLAPPDGISRMGTTHAFSRLTRDMQVTVVGDVPALTVKEIGMAVNLSGH